jgi:hypothetical protein
MDGKCRGTRAESLEQQQLWGTGQWSRISLVLIISLSTLCWSSPCLLTPVEGLPSSSFLPLHRRPSQIQFQRLQQEAEPPLSPPALSPLAVSTSGSPVTTSSSDSKPSWRLPYPATSTQALKKREESEENSGASVTPLVDLVKRHFPVAYHDLFHFKLQPGLVVANSVSNIHDTFKISSSNENDKVTLLIEGASLSALGAGLNYYLRNVCQVEMSWSGDRFDQIPDVPPKLKDNTGIDGEVIVRASFVPWRYYMNVVTFGYSFAFWDWSRWERELGKQNLLRLCFSALVNSH